MVLPLDYKSTIYFYIHFRAAVAPTAEDVESCPVNVNNVVATDDMHHIRSFNQSDSSSNLIKLIGLSTIMH